MRPPLWLVEVLVLLAIVAGLSYFCYEAGRHLERAVWIEKEAKTVKATRDEYDGHLQAANQAASAALAAAADSRDFALNLQQEIAHVPVPLVSVASCPARAGGAASGRVALVAEPASGVAGDWHWPRAGAAADQPAPAPGDALPGSDAGGGAGITLSAVRLWNSALAGQRLPAGACEPADPTSAACAAASGISFEDLWANHTENATRCNVGRASANALIDYLQTTQGATP